MKPIAWPILASILTCFLPLYAGDLSLGLNYPGVGLKYGLSDHVSAELRMQYDPDAQAYGLRGYWHWLGGGGRRLGLYSGLEADYVTFRHEDLSGPGYAVLGFCGVEYYVVSWLSVLLDVGPAWVGVYDPVSGVSAAGLEFVVNAGVYWYFMGVDR